MLRAVSADTWANGCPMRPRITAPERIAPSPSTGRRIEPERIMDMGHSVLATRERGPAARIEEPNLGRGAGPGDRCHGVASVLFFRIRHIETCQTRGEIPWAFRWPRELGR